MPMSDITCREYVVTLSLDTTKIIPYRPRRDLTTIVTSKPGERVTIKYVSGSQSYWYVDVHGSYPLHEPVPVCQCSPDVRKSRQQVSVRIGYPHHGAHVPSWVYALVQEHAPEWYTL